MELLLEENKLFHRYINFRIKNIFMRIGYTCIEYQKYYCKNCCPHAVCRFLKEEPDSIEDALKRCKRLTGTLFTLKRWDQCIIIALYPKKYCPLIQRYECWVSLNIALLQPYIFSPLTLPYNQRNTALYSEMRTLTEHCPVSGDENNLRLTQYRTVSVIPGLKIKTAVWFSI